MRSLFDGMSRVSTARLLAQKDEELRELRAQLTALRNEHAQAQSENQRMRAGMRRCVTCEYRIEVRSKRAEHKLIGRAQTSAAHDAQRTEPDDEHEPSE